MKNKRRFASFLLTGKVASFPFFMPNQNFAQFISLGPGTDLLSPDVHIIELPAPGIRLLSTLTEAPPPTGYGGGTAAEICVASPSAPTSMTVSITGVRTGDMVFLVASTDTDDPVLQAFVNPAIRVGKNNVILKVFDVDLGARRVTDLSETGALDATSVIPVSVDLSGLSQQGFLAGQKFFLQAAAFQFVEDPVTKKVTLDFAGARVSELDQIDINTSPTCY